ncbi:tyrosine-type recombinase/integrase [Fulvivirgaceae bacterium BMA10]|uniref:Tyrosine-type recombinase/integrase n=2 Tax=Splendidivirga corallicola TaxID=3051826 RepID=A0ABT8KMP7_9BACT|nr:tyrosine-type recombinase/integrase [Fulvivirgaceae bacterium BMA10]
MQYLTLRNGWYVYNRRVPDFLKTFDPRQRVRIALNTKCKATAMKKLTVLNDEVEGYWKDLIKLKQTHTKDKFKALVNTARRLGFTYVPSSKLVDIPLNDLLERIFAVKHGLNEPDLVKAVLGDKERPDTLLSDCLDKFWNYSKPALLNKNADQQRKWKNPRIKAVKNFITSVEDKPITEITNLDLIRFRDWWLERMRQENIKANTINKDFTHLKSVLETVCTHEQLDIDIDGIFKKIHIKEEDRETRQPYETTFIQNEILNSETLKGLEEEAKYILQVCINTGARPIELVNLIAEDIHLDAPVPYIHIRPRKGYSLKTKESKRKLPLVGTALEAFKTYPNGFTTYQGKSDQATSTINEYLTKNNLRPTLKHSLYSCRHSFQDRLTALEIPDRIQCQLMGHKFHRPKYGNGASLEHLHEIMGKVKVLNLET